ncbi:unnamed protein product, partial [Cladocopium goreaui]
MGAHQMAAARRAAVLESLPRMPPSRVGHRRPDFKPVLPAPLPAVPPAVVAPHRPRTRCKRARQDFGVVRVRREADPAAGRSLLQRQNTGRSVTLPPGPPLQRALLESAQDVPSQRGAWQAAPFAWDVRRRLFHGFCGACGEESWDLQQMQLQRVTVLYRQKAGHGV